LQERIKQGFNDSPKGACLELTMQLIETKTLGTSTSGIEFTSIPQTYTDLKLVWSLRSSGGNDYMFMTLNGSSSSFTSRYLLGTGSAVTSASRTDGGLQSAVGKSDYTSNTFSNGELYFPNYSGSANKSFSMDTVLENNATANQLQLLAGLWANSAGITSIGFSDTFTSNNFIAGSTMSLYGILKGTLAGVVVS
jgi:hypothetical protein